MRTAWTTAPQLAKHMGKDTDPLPYENFEDALAAMTKAAHAESREMAQRANSGLGGRAPVSNQTIARVFSLIKDGNSTYDEITAGRRLNETTVRRAVNVLVQQGRVVSLGRKGRKSAFAVAEVAE